MAQASSSPRRPHARATLVMGLALGISTQLGPSATAQFLPDPGPLPVGWRNETMPFVGNQTIKNRIYYPATATAVNAPADPSGGPYPLVALIHGATAAPKDYDVISHHVASHGYVVASLGAMSLLHENFDNMADETAELIDWVVAASNDPATPYAGLVWDGDFGVIGSSRGGGAVELLVGLEPRLAVAAEMEPRFHVSFEAFENLAAWDGTWLAIAGELDTTVPPGEVQQLLAQATGSPRRLFFEILGAGHAGALDPDTPGLPVGEPMPHEQQLSLHARLVLSVMQAVLRDDEDHFHDLVGNGMAGEPLVIASTCSDPPLWCVESTAPARVALGLAGSDGDDAWLVLSPAAGRVPTQYGVLGLDPTQAFILPAVQLGAEALHELVMDAPPSASGWELHVQGLIKHAAGGGRLSRTDTLIVP